MSKVLFATDFSEAADRAVEVAAAWARREGARLSVVHVVDAQPTRERLAERREALAARIARSSAPDAEIDVRVGDVATEVVHAAAGAAAILVAPGRTFEAVAALSTIPVLAVRPGLDAPDRPLRVLVGVDLSSASNAALHWAIGLRARGPCDITVAYEYPEEEADRMHVDGVPSRTDVEAALRAEIEKRAGTDQIAIIIEPTATQPASRLAALAAAADLVVLGDRTRTGLDRLFHGSTAHDLLGRAPCSIALVPAAADSGSVVHFRSVLVPMDFAPASLAALPYARGLAGAGGRLVLVHVCESGFDDPSDRTERHDAVRRRLAALVPSGHATLVVVDDPSAVAGVLAVAERYAVDAICVTAREATLSRSIRGSVADGVIARSRRPVLLVPPEGR